MTITQTYHMHAFTYPNRIAIQMKERSVTYREWNQLVEKTSYWLQKQTASNQKIAILMNNSISFLQLFAGAAAAGWIAIPLDPKWSSYELHERLMVCQPSIIVTTEHLKAKIGDTSASVRLVDNCLSDILSQSDNYEIEIQPNLPFYMGFTSGSTGKPKAFLRAQQSWVESFDCNVMDLHMTKEEHVLIPGSLISSHFLYGTISTLHLGGTVYLMEKFIPSQVIDTLNHFPISVMYAVPTMIEALLRENTHMSKPIKVISSGAKWKEQSKEQLNRLFPSFTFYELYGASELSFISVLSHQDKQVKPLSVGKPCHNVEITIVGTDQKPVKRGETGKIFVKSQMTFMGYLQENGSLQGNDLEWMTVDDMGYLDEDGFLYILGRANQMILYGGMNIFPEEIEAVLSVHPEVDEAAVIGLPDPYWGQIAAAVIKGTASEQALKRYSKEILSSYKVPKKWIFVKELPHTTSGKVARKELLHIIQEMDVAHE
ncbi:AMP-binding protein [Bacillus sp. 03113]|uniref:AMP-binding protein n=1 Tax=Bacillus sp. 03113 TaxID=2578211 RepID=UPI0011450044|nr:AMP-binding protein [Bacillus sp. 03113]